MLTYSFNSQDPRVKNLPKGLPSGRIGLRIPKGKKVTIIRKEEKNNKNSNNDNNNNNNINSNGNKNNRIIISIIKIITIIIIKKYYE